MAGCLGASGRAEAAIAGGTGEGRRPAPLGGPVGRISFAGESRRLTKVAFSKGGKSCKEAGCQALTNCFMESIDGGPSGKRLF